MSHHLPRGQGERRGAFGLGRIEQLDRSTRHHGADRVLVDELGVAVPAQQHGEIVEPGNDALQLHAVYEEHRHRRLAFADVVQEDVLHVLRLFAGHDANSFILLIAAQPTRFDTKTGTQVLSAQTQCSDSERRRKDDFAAVQRKPFPARTH